MEIEHEFSMREVGMTGLVKFLRDYLALPEKVDIIPHVCEWTSNAITLLYSSGGRNYRLVGTLKSATIYLLDKKLNTTGISEEYRREWQAFMVDSIGRPYAEKLNIIIEEQRK